MRDESDARAFEVKQGILNRIIKTMRRFVFLTLALIVCTFSFGDEPNESKTRFYRHEVNVSIGGIGVRSGILTLRQVRWFMEIGFGANTNFQTGLTYRFGRY